jgi:uncharacterized phiE125 gp8 family phage protein
VDGIRGVLDPALYRVDAASTPARVIIATRPPRMCSHDCLEITFMAGYGEPASVPTAIRQAILEVVAALYLYRGDEAVPIGRSGQVLLAPYRIFKL